MILKTTTPRPVRRPTTQALTTTKLSGGIISSTMEAIFLTRRMPDLSQPPGRSSASTRASFGRLREGRGAGPQQWRPMSRFCRETKRRAAEEEVEKLVGLWKRGRGGEGQWRSHGGDEKVVLRSINGSCIYKLYLRSLQTSGGREGGGDNTHRLISRGSSFWLLKLRIREMDYQQFSFYRNFFKQTNPGKLIFPS